MRVVAAPDKFRGTATAAQVASAIGAAAWEVGWECDEVPLADGGDGLLAVLGGANRSTMVHDPLGRPVEAEWRFDGQTAVIEMARASGLDVVGGSDENDPVAASTRGVGELIVAAVESGARRVIVGLGGSATTDGGLGALRAISSRARLGGAELIVGCDVQTHFVDAAATFGPQKGASRAQVRLLENRLRRLVDVYRDDHGVDVCGLAGSGAAGGLAGGLAAVGATLVSGFSLVADEVGLDEHVAGADLVVTGEGFLDAESFEGKVVGGVREMADAAGTDVVAIVGQVVDVPDDFEVHSLTDRFGLQEATGRTLGCIRDIAAEILAARSTT